jgi:hypothetical protein
MSAVTRRDFLKNTGMASGAALAAPAAAAQPPERAPEIHLFSKPLHWISDYGRLAETAAAMGLAGLDLTVRPEGHVRPESVRRDLPLAVKAAEARGLKIRMIVTAVNAADESAETLLRTDMKPVNPSSFLQTASVLQRVRFCCSRLPLSVLMYTRDPPCLTRASLPRRYSVRSACFNSTCKCISNSEEVKPASDCSTRAAAVSSRLPWMLNFTSWYDHTP